MSNTRATIEVIAPTIEEAVTKGLSDLGLTEEAVDIEILDEGSRGLFGLGSRQARIRLSVKSPSSSSAKAEKPTPSSDSSVELNTPNHLDDIHLEPEAQSTEDLNQQPATEQVGTSGTPDGDALRIARETVEELLQNMRVKAIVSARYGEADQARGRVPILIDINGKDLSILIGRQAETLNALQYITTLIVGKELGRSTTLVIDVEGYRQRREQQVRQLAQRMAEQAINTGRRQVLEPMPANERRFVHIELRENPSVTTESIGEEPHRKVTIIPQ